VDISGDLRAVSKRSKQPLTPLWGRGVQVALWATDATTGRGAVVLAVIALDVMDAAASATVAAVHHVLPERHCEPPELARPYAEDGQVTFLLIMRTREPYDACISGGPPVVLQGKEKDVSEEEEEEELPPEATLEAVRARVGGGGVVVVVRRSTLTDDSMFAMGASWQPCTGGGLADTVAVAVGVPHGVHVCVASLTAAGDTLAATHAHTAVRKPDTSIGIDVSYVRKPDQSMHRCIVRRRR
jgi:hypothetical protein